MATRGHTGDRLDERLDWQWGTFLACVTGVTETGGVCGIVFALELHPVLALQDLCFMVLSK